RSVAAFDIDDGRVLWTTESLLSWSQTWPTSDPIALEGRVYVLVAHHDEDLSQVFLPVGLAALDAPTGREIWRSHLASSRHIASTRLPRRYGDLVPIDLAHYGGSLACDGDSIYCSTSLGLVARVDARDGLIHWCRVYPRSQADPDWSRLLRRAASPPALSGDAVVFAPRDWTGALAADRETGDLLWSSRFLPSERLLGAWKDLVLLHGDGQLIALRASDGSTAWKRETSVGADERAVLSGGSIYVLGDDRIARYDAGRGSELEAPAAHRGLRALAAGDGALIALGEEPEHFAQDPPPAISAAARGRREIPLDAEFRLAVRLARPQPSLLLPPRGSPVIDRLLLLADNLLECLDGGEPGRVLWRRSVDRRFIDIGWSGRDIILIYLGSACAVCLETGATRWSARFPFAAASRAMSGRYLVLLKKRPPGVGAALIDLETGRLLWNRVLGPLFRELILHDASFEEGVIHLVGQDRDERHRERRIGTTVTLGIEDGSLLACRRYPRSALLTKADRRFVYDIDESGQPLVTTLADPPEQARFTSAAKVDFDWGRTQMAIFGEWLQVRVHFQDSRIHDYRQWIYRRGDPGYVYHLPSDGDIQGGIVHCPTVEGLEVHDLPSRRLAMKYSLPDPGRDRFHRVIGSWEDDGRVLVVASVLRGRNDREPQAIRADVFESATALHTGGRPLPDVMYWYRRADNDPLWRETQVAWRGGALYVTEPRGAAVFVPAADAEEDPGGGGAGEEQAPRLPRQDPAPLQQRRRPDRR
ncbi:MAG: PQQ-like beta-propeller repeat protein, partial [Planctomycetes bacterium]|nr:PQQ-like beta-propeller repeat protein [Planctomycetota bacterium]